MTSSGMWLFALFDLPTGTKQERTRAARFRTQLLRDGFFMFQFSVYCRYCDSSENLATHVRRVRAMLPPNGHVALLPMTDRQKEGILVFHGLSSQPAPEAPKQLTLF